MGSGHIQAAAQCLASAVGLDECLDGLILVANEADRHFDFRPSRWCKSSQTSSRTCMLSEKVLPLTPQPDPQARESTITPGFLLSMYSTMPSGEPASKGSGSPDVPRRKPDAFLRVRSARVPRHFLGLPGSELPADQARPAPGSRFATVPRSPRTLIIADRRKLTQMKMRTLGIRHGPNPDPDRGMRAFSPASVDA